MGHDESKLTELNHIYPNGTTLPCVVCSKELTNVFPEHLEPGCNQPNDASSLSTEGHYGDSFFDPGSGAKLEVNICTECMQKLWDDRKVAYYPDGNVGSTAFVKA